MHASPSDDISSFDDPLDSIIHALSVSNKTEQFWRRIKRTLKYFKEQLCSHEINTNLTIWVKNMC